jgi:hypothetical protein
VDLVEECWDADVLRHSLGFVRANPMLVRHTMSCSRASVKKSSDVAMQS